MTSSKPLEIVAEFFDPPRGRGRRKLYSYYRSVQSAATDPSRPCQQDMITSFSGKQSFLRYFESICSKWLILSRV